MNEARRIAVAGRSRLTAATAILLLVLLSGCNDSPESLEDIRQLHQNLRYGESLEPLRRLIGEGSSDPEVYLLYGSALIRAGSPSLAIWPLRKAMEDPEWTVRAAIMMAAGATQTGNVESAMAYATSALEIEPDNIEALSLRCMGRVHSRRDYEGALADADRILELDPENPIPLVARTTALLALDRVEEAAEALEALENHNREDVLAVQQTARFCVARSIFQMEKGEPEKSEEILLACLEEFPSAQTTVAEAIKRYDEAGETDRSIEVLEGALAEDSPWEREFRVNLASRLRMTGRPAEAEALLVEAIEGAGNPVLETVFWADLGSHHFETGDLQKSADAAQKAYELSPKPVPPDILFDYAEALLLAKRFEEATLVADEIELPPYREFILARIAQLQGRPAEALKHFDAGHLLWPDSPVARYYTARAAEALGLIDRAIHEYRYAMRIDPRGTDARFRLANLHEAEGEYWKAAVAAGHGGHSDNPEPASKIILVRLLAKAGSLDAVENALAPLLLEPAPIPTLAVQAAIEGARTSGNTEWALSLVDQMQGLDLRDPENAPLLRARIRLLGDLGRSDEAVRAAERSLKTAPREAEFHAIHGLALFQRGDSPKAAAEAYQRTLEIDPNHVVAMLELGRLVRADGDLERAMALNEKVLAAYPNHPVAWKQKARLLMAAERNAEAEAAWEQILQASPHDPEALNTLARLQEARGEDPARTAALRRRAARFEPAKGVATAVPASSSQKPEATTKAAQPSGE